MHACMGCRYVGVLLRAEERRIGNDDKIIYFKGRNRLFFSRFTNPLQIRVMIRKLLSTVQRWLLKSFEKELFGSYYLSSYKLRKLTPYPADHMRFSLERLLDLGLLKAQKVDISMIHKSPQRVMDISEIVRGLKDGLFKKARQFPSAYELSFYMTPRQEEQIKEFKRSMVKEELIEHETVKQVYMRILQRYKRSLKLYGMRTRDPRLLKLFRGYSFDTCCSSRRRQFGGKRLLAVDVYTRLPLSEAIVCAFARKVDSTGCYGRIYTRECHSNLALKLCKKHGIHLIYLKNTTVDPDKICLGVEAKLNEISFD